MLQILEETAEYIAVYKRAGLAVETRRFSEPDLESEICRHLGTSEVHVITRLDQVVEGIVLFAKNAAAAAKLTAQQSDHRMKKTYLAVVQDPQGKTAGAAEKNVREETHTAETAGKETLRPEDRWVTLTDHLLRDGRTNTSRVVKVGTKGAKKSALRYRVLSRNAEEGTALLQIDLLTGRHHQIRVQLSHAGLPIAGDRKYGPDVEQKNASGRVFPALCAAGLVFDDPAGGGVRSLSVTPQNAVFALHSPETISTM